ncbi:hypothetical protein KFL_006290030 [Klebsormidium nitens]|uniref:Calcineurin-like phosphoesterase domain-containing protein n=1 Tax=Klebsormidium nitens TaxID=105231 RepID=A0A1Y1IQC2_KLENI|nr:hypothetical protein KFL_006290030 [Klebsormidium nitens]|eukprot:GAQ90338.1 hypothetical protein KFL_006290030 [Klebsormidium nitens]
MFKLPQLQTFLDKSSVSSRWSQSARGGLLGPPRKMQKTGLDLTTSRDSLNMAGCAIDHTDPGGIKCEAVPTIWSSFVDAFVDASAMGSVGKRNLRGLPASKLPAPERLVAIGDLHGDLRKARRAFRLAGVVDEKDRWIGGKTVVVQVGDVLDRGDQELQIFHMLERLQHQARKAGGDVHVLNGNHETINVEGRFTYATPGSKSQFDRWMAWHEVGKKLKKKCRGALVERNDSSPIFPPHVPPHFKSRYAALRPGGPASTRFFGTNPTVLQVGSTVFVHGGLLPGHVDYGLDRINKETSEWIQGKSGPQGPAFTRGRNAVVWLREFSLPKVEPDCRLLQEVLGKIPGAERMVVGHTIQFPLGVTGACNNRVIRVDVGMSSGCYDAQPEVIEIRNDEEVRILSEERKPELLDSSSRKGGVQKANAEKRTFMDIVRESMRTA